MKRVMICLLLITPVVLFICGSVMAEDQIFQDTASMGATSQLGGHLYVNIQNRDQSPSPPTTIQFNGGNPIDLGAPGLDKWWLADQMIEIDYVYSSLGGWAIRMVTDNIATYEPDPEYAIYGIGLSRSVAGMIPQEDTSNKWNRPRIVFQVYDVPTPTSTLDDDHIYGYDANDDGIIDPVESDPLDIKRAWGIMSDKADSDYAGWDANGDLDYLDINDGVDANGDGDYLDTAEGDIPPTTGYDANGDGDYLDDGEYPPDVANVTDDGDPSSSYFGFWVVQGAGSSSSTMWYPDSEQVTGDNVFVYFGAELGGGAAAATYQTEIFVELISL